MKSLLIKVANSDMKELMIHSRFRWPLILLLLEKGNSHLREEHYQLKLKLSIIALLSLVLLFGMSTFAIATDTRSLDGIGQPVTQQQNTAEENPPTQVVTPQHAQVITPQPSAEDFQSKAQAVGDLFSKAGVTKESLDQANIWLTPVAKIMNKVMAVILGLTSIALFLITVLDIMYIAFPPIRPYLTGGGVGSQGNQQSGAPMQRGYNNGVYGSGQNGFGMPVGNTPGAGIQQSGTSGSFGRWISDEALAATKESEESMYVGALHPKPVKSLIFSYMKKRSMFLIMFGVTVVLFTSTIFSDIGVKLGMLILGWFAGIHF